jgi:hypothetical protein
VRKQKVIKLHKEQLNKRDLDVISKLNVGLDMLDQMPTYTPDLQWFEKMVLDEQQSIKKKLIRDLTLYTIIALIILSGIIVSLFNMPLIFIFLQIGTTASIVMYLGIGFFKQVRSHE